MTLKIPVPKNPHRPFSYPKRGLRGFFAQVPKTPLPASSPFTASGLCGFFINAGPQALPAKSIFPQFVMRQNGSQCGACARPCGARRGMGQDDGGDFGTGSYPTSISDLGPGLEPTPITGEVTGANQGLDLSSLLYTSPTTPTVTAANQGDLSSGFLTSAPVLGGSSAPTTVPMSQIAPILAENATEGISSIAPSVTSAVGAATLTAAQLSALQANPNLTAAQLQALAAPSGFSQWLSAKSTMFPNETNGSLLVIGGVLGLAGLVFASIAGGKKRR